MKIIFYKIFNNFVTPNTEALFSLCQTDILEAMSVAWYQHSKTFFLLLEKFLRRLPS